MKKTKDIPCTCTCTCTCISVEFELEMLLWARIEVKNPQELRGFSLVELMLALAIIGIVTSIAIPSYKEHFDKKDNALAKADIVAAADCVNRYSVLNGNTYPDTLADGYCDVGDDPWGRAYEYLNIANEKGKGKVRKDHGIVPINTKFDLYSKGKDGRSQSPLTSSHSKDDIVYGRDGRFIGLGKDF